MVKSRCLKCDSERFEVSNEDIDGDTMTFVECASCKRVVGVLKTPPPQMLAWSDMGPVIQSLERIEAKLGTKSST